MNESEPFDDAALERCARESRQLLDAPEPLIQRAIQLWNRPARQPAGPGTVRRVLAAALAFDSFSPETALAAVRASGSDLRQLLFEIGSHDVDVRIRRSGGMASGGWSVTGQLLGPEVSGRIFLQCGGFESSLAWSAQGEFQFEPVPGGECRIMLETDEWTVDLPVFELPDVPASGGR